MGLVGEIGDVQIAMQRAGWLPARPITMRSALGIVGAVALDRSDPRAPMSDLFLDGRRQDLAFERQVDASPRRRHHVRFWRQGQQVDGATLWLGAATFDEGVTIALGSGQVTHRTSPNIDEERDTLVDDLERGGCAGAVHDTPGIGPRAGARTAEGRPIDTDGRVAVVELGCDPNR
ncbi:MAG TPA: LssY C-terminal domain-containing protein [Polyangia bacterium]|nr:LssY C-terminal domain-containing protein [Polyangia bacterium]